VEAKNIDEIIEIKNELSNDGLIYINYVRPILSESVTDAIAFFKSWQDNASTSEQFLEELTVIQKKMKVLNNNF